MLNVTYLNKKAVYTRQRGNGLALHLKLFLILLITASIFSACLLAQVAPVNPPTGGFNINGGLKANTSAGDWVAGSGGGGFVLSNTGTPVNSATSGLATDAYNSGQDYIFTTGSKFNDVISALQWTQSSAPNKNDINNGMYHVSTNPGPGTSTGDQWVMIGGDRLSTSGTSYIDFEFLQNTLRRDVTGGKFTGAGPDGGRTIGDLVISMEYTGGGSTANVYFYQWKVKAGGGYEFVQFTPATGTAFAQTNLVNEDVPFGAFGLSAYAPYAFVESAVNITKLLQAAGGACAGLSIKSLWIKTKASSSSTAALKDFMEPIPVSFTFGSASISYAIPFCKAAGTTATATRTGTSGGTYSASPAGLSIDPNTGTIDIGNSTAGSYTVTYSFNAGGTCTKTATAPVVINPTPTVSVNSPVKCANDPAVTITATPTPATGTYSYAWTVPVGVTNPGNVAGFSATVGGIYGVTATLSGCSGNGSGTLTANPNPTITSPAIANICVGTTSASVTYSGLTGSPDKYRIDWNTAAESAGLTDITLTNLPASPFTINIPGTLAASTYTGTIYVKNSTTGCESTGGAISLTVNANATANAGTAPAAQCYDAANGNTFSLSGSGANGNPSWAVQSKSDNALNVVITNGNTFAPSVKVTGGSGTITLRLTVTSTFTPSCGTPTSDVTVSVNPNATASAGTAPTAQCHDATNGSTFSLSGSGTNGTPSWAVAPNGNPNNLTVQITGGSTYTPSVKVSGGPGSVTLRLTVNSGTGCGAPTSNVTVTVNPLPTANAGTDPAAQCYGASGNTFSLNGSGTNGTYLWTVKSKTNNALVVDITNGTTLTPSVSVSGSTSGGTITLTLTVTSNTTPVCGNATDDVDLKVTAQVGGPDAVMLPVICTDATFKVQVNSPVTGTTYTATQPLNGNTYSSTIVYNGTGSVIFTGLKFGDGFSVKAAKDGCESAPSVCDNSKLQSTTNTTGVVNQQTVSAQQIELTPQPTVKAFPNPYSDKVRFSVKSAVSGQGTLDLYNLLGQKVKTVFQGHVEAGQVQNFEYNVPNANRSNLIYIFRVGDQRVSGKLLH